MVYTSYAQGFRTGGYTQTGKFDNEVTKNYELGFKSTLLDGMLSLNGAAYHIDYTNQQVSFVNFYYDENGDFQVARGVINIARSRVDGMELELSAAPTEKLRVSAGIGVSDSVALEIDPNPLVPADQINSVIGNKSPFVPAFTFNLSGTWTEPVSDSMDLIIHGDYRREGNFYHDIANNVKTGAHNYINGKIALESVDGWSFGVWGKNLLNSRVATYVNPSSGVRQPNQPRTYGVEASFRF
jgi:iron complex outermembrane receptor protein